MDEFRVKLSKVRKTVREQNNIAKQMRRLEDEVRRVYKSLSFEVAQKEQIRKRLQKAGDDISAECNGIYKATRALGNIANTYEQTDLKLVGAKPKKGMITPVTAASAVMNLLFGPGVTTVALNPEVQDAVVGPIKKVFDREEVKVGELSLSEYKDKDGKSHSASWRDESHDKSFWSYNNDNGELKDSEIDLATKVVSAKWKGSRSLFSDKNLVGDEEGSHVKTEFDIVKREASAELYGGLYFVDPKTGQQKLRAAVGAEMGVAVSALSMSQELQLGNKNLGLYGKAEETLGRGELKGEGVVGLRDAEGNINPTVHGKLSAEAIAAEVSVKGGAKIIGADVGVKGAVNFGVGAHVEVGLKDGKFSADVGASMGLGVSVKLEVDISGTVDAVAGRAKAAWNDITGLFT